MSTPFLRRLATACLAGSACWLTGCDLLGIEPASALAAKREAEGKAIGAGCRHAARSIEQCFESNKRADKAAVFAGWREMEDYMRDNKIAAVPAPPPPSDASLAANGEEEKAEPAEAKGGKGGKGDKGSGAAAKKGG